MNDTLASNDAPSGVGRSLEGEFAIPASVSMTLSVMFAFVALVAAAKEVVPQLLLRFKRYRHRLNQQARIASLRVLWFFSLVFVAALGMVQWPIDTNSRWVDTCDSYVLF
jgi:hypothetical protein